MSDVTTHRTCTYCGKPRRIKFRVYHVPYKKEGGIDNDVSFISSREAVGSENYKCEFGIFYLLMMDQ